MTTVLLADDHPVVRQGLKALLEAEGDFNVVGEASDGLDALAMTERLQPDVLLADIMMPGLNGLEVVRQLKTRAPRTKAIVFSMHATDAHIHEAFRNGAYGYLLKGSGAEEMAEAVRTVTTGRRYLTPSVSERLIDAYLDHAQTFGQKDAYDDLTSREREVFQLVAEGLTSAQIADRLCISPRTVEIHRSNALRKLSLKSQSEVVRYAVQRGLITLE
jgi:Response regulator containing a CheY-like receiver domain and an HTH DNA-binding domain